MAYAVTLSKPYPLTLWNRWNNEKKVRVSEKERRVSVLPFTRRDVWPYYNFTYQWEIRKT